MKPFYLLLVCLCFQIPSWCQSAPPDENEAQFEKILQNKNDADFEFYMSSGANHRFKYFLHNDSLWFAGANTYITVIPLSNVNFAREPYFNESGIWKTKANSKCYEVGLYASKGKFFGKEFEVEAFKSLDEGPVDFANLIFPDRAFAEGFIKYLKEHRP